ncbi:MAG: flagellar hook-basal body complex protein FliE [Bdellovibrionia bacterium]
MSNLMVDNLSQFARSGEFLRSYADRVQTQRGEMLESPGAENPGRAGESGKTFSEILTNSMDQVNLHQAQADTAIKEMVAGRNKNIHETMLTIERADTSLKLMMQVRNKILDAYREIMRMQV